MKFFLLFSFSFFILFTGKSQDFSNKGKDFWVAYPAHIDGTASVMGIYLTSDVNATGQIDVAGTIVPFTLIANQVTYKFIGPNGGGSAGNIAPYLTAQDGIKIGAGIHITSDNSIAVYAHIIRSARSGATLVLPTKVLGIDYIAPSYRNAGNSAGYGEIAVMASLPNTIIEVTPSVTSRDGLKTPGISYQITLVNPGDVYQLQFQSAADISGTRVKSIASGAGGCKPIAVFSATTWTGLACTNSSGGDNLFQQLFPISTWGKQFLTAPLKKISPISSDLNPDIIRVFVTDPTTVVTKTENGVTTTLTGLTGSNYYEYSSFLPTQIQASKPVQVVQYITSQTCGSPATQSDPEMIVLSSVEQTINDITVFSAHQNFVPPGQSAVTTHYLNIIMKTNNTSSFRINGALPVSAFTAIPGTAYSYIKENITINAATNPVSRLTADSGFSAIAYGFGNVESYGYNAGTNVKDLYQQIGVSSEFGIETTPSVCSGSPFKFKVSLPYLADSIFWDLSRLPGSQSNVKIRYSVPAQVSDADSTTMVNGRPIYWYSLPASYTLNTVGIFPVTISAFRALSDGCGNSQDIDFDLEVSAPPNADFTFTTNGCFAQPVQFNDATTTVKPTYKWIWDFGDPASGSNNTSSLKNPTHTFSAPGTYTVTYSNITTPGCISNTVTKQVTVTEVPVANFNISPTLCIDKSVTFTDASTITPGLGILTKWYWDFGDGTRDTSNDNTDRIHSYTTAGNKTATLIVETNGGCKSVVFSKIFFINPQPLADFILPAGVCLPDSARFTDASTIADNTQSGFTYLWTFGDAISGGANTSTIKNPAHLYNTTGPFDINLQVTSAAGCVHDTTKRLSNIYPKAKSNFSVNPETCLNDSTYFTDQSNGQGSSITNWFWDFGDATSSTLQNPVHKFSAAGTYNVKLYIQTDKNCLSDTISKQVVINPLPTASFTTSSPVCETKNVTFTSTSVANAGNIILWKWNMGDGTTLNLNSAAPFTHVYASAGTYTVTLLVETDKSCKSSVYYTQLTINPQPQPGFILPDVCLSDAFAQFIDTSKIATGSITNWQWNFGDPSSGVLNTSTIQNPQHKYLSVGNYTVTLTVTSNNGCIATVAQNFTVNGDVPVANFIPLNPSGLCANDSVEIRDASTVNFGKITKVEIYWDNTGTPLVFQTDNSPTPGKIYKHLYPNLQSNKTYTIRYRAYSGLLCVNEISKNIIVNAAPKVQFNAIPNTCFYVTPYQITQASEIGGVPGSGAFTGNGISASGLFNPTNAGVGTHILKYTFTSSNGCIDTASQTILVLAPPIADFNFSSPDCETRAITFSDNSTSTAGTLTTWTWDFGDGTAPVVRNSSATFTHIFATPNTYTVSLTVTTNDGCNSAVFTKPLKVNPLPVVNFSVSKSCLPIASAQFTDLTTIADGSSGQFSYLWNFGDPNSGSANTSNQKNPLHVYSAMGPYNVTLQVTSKDGCVKDTIKVYNDIHPQPKANFVTNSSAVCLGTPIVFTDNSNGADGTVQQYNWMFGDGTTSTQPYPSHTYSSAGTFTVNLAIVNSQGCTSDTFQKSVIVYPYPLVNAGPDRSVLEGGTIVLEPVVTGNNLQYLWSPNTYLNNNTILNPVVSGVADITYTLTVTAQGGCVSSDQVFVKVLKFPVIPNTFTPNSDGINDVWTIQNLDTYPDSRVQVFNRYGQLVFESKGYTKPWNGVMNGRTLPIGTYYYVIEPGNGRKPITGYVTLLK